jgi:CRISPR-associated protein Cas1
MPDDGAIPAVHLAQLRFRVCAPIEGLSIYHGPMWNALFRDLLRPHLPPAAKLHETGIYLNPIETRLIRLQAGDPLHVGLVFPVEAAAAVCAALAGFNDWRTPRGNLRPGETILLENLQCRVSGQTVQNGEIAPHHLRVLDDRALAPERAALAAADRFSLIFYTPLRLFRPEGQKQDGHNLCDPHYFLGSRDDGRSALAHLLTHLGAGADPADRTGLRIGGGTLFLLDNTYGRFKTPIGGVTGRLDLTGRPTAEEARLLVLGQYLGLGKNRTFGLGFYHFPELDAVRVVRPLTRARTLLDRAFSPQALADACEHLSDGIPGPDGLSMEDVRQAGDELFARTGSRIGLGQYTPSPGTRGWLPKKSGGYRAIVIYNMLDRLVHRAAADFLLPLVDAILSRDAWAYRRGLNRQGAGRALQQAMAEGFNSGIKADIEAFFDSVDMSRMAEVLTALLPFDPLPGFIAGLLASPEGPRGLPQGSPLSPVLSNLYLDRFDRRLSGQGIRLVRYGDDFVALFKDDGFEDGKKKIVDALAALDLNLQEEKTAEVIRGCTIPFLGYLVSEQRVRDADKEIGDDSERWLPLFTDQWRTGLPVYLSVLSRGAFSSGTDLVVTKEDDSQEKIPWNRISRIIIVGRSKVSGGLVYRAAKEQIPLTYLDIMGRPISQLAPARLTAPDLVGLQRQKFEDTCFCLNLSRAIAAAKIHNCYVLLRRNGIHAEGLKIITQKALEAAGLDSLRGIEGAGSRVYFRHLAKLVAPFPFRGRKYHPPDGPVNVMLSFGYTLLRQRIEAILLDKGFDARIGFNHRSKGRHLALASDMMENLRILVDRMVLALIRLREIRPEHFSVHDKGPVALQKLEGEGFRSFIHRFEHSMARQFTHEGTTMSYNQYLDVMVEGLIRSMKMDISYKPLRIS